jgi:hypothetical protein
MDDQPQAACLQIPLDGWGKSGFERGTVMFVVLRDNGFPSREVAVNRRGEVVHRFPDPRFRYGSRGYFDSYPVDPRDGQRITEAEFEERWAEPANPAGQEMLKPGGRARWVAAGAGCLWLFLAGVLGLLSLAAAAVSLPAFIIFGSWMLGAVILAFLLLARRPTRRTLLASLVLAVISTVLGVLSILGSSADFQTGTVAFSLTAAGAAAYSGLALKRLPRVPEPN